MKYTLITLALFAVAAASASSAGQFMPRAFFTLDSEGHPSNVHQVNEHILRRLRRQVFASSSSSSSSSSSGNGQNYVSTSQVVQHPDGSVTSGQSYSQQIAPAVAGIIQNRFSDDSPSGGAYNSGSYNSGAYNSGAYNPSYSTGASLSSNSASYGSGGVPLTQIHQSVTQTDANGQSVTTTLTGHTDQSGNLHTQTQKTQY